MCVNIMTLITLLTMVVVSNKFNFNLHEETHEDVDVSNNNNNWIECLLLHYKQLTNTIIVSEYHTCINSWYTVIYIVNRVLIVAHSNQTF